MTPRLCKRHPSPQRTFHRYTASLAKLLVLSMVVAESQGIIMARTKKPVVAFAYDFDGTLSPGNMQEHSFLPKLGMDPKAFWAKVSADAKRAEGDNILMYMQLMLEQARAARESVTRQRFREHGRAVRCFPVSIPGLID